MTSEEESHGLGEPKPLFETRARRAAFARRMRQGARECLRRWEAVEAFSWWAAQFVP